MYYLNFLRMKASTHEDKDFKHSKENWTKPKILRAWNVKSENTLTYFCKSFVNLCIFCIFCLNFEENKERLFWNNIILVFISSGKGGQVSKGSFYYLHSSRKQPFSSGNFPCCPCPCHVIQIKKKILYPNFG